MAGIDASGTVAIFASSGAFLVSLLLYRRQTKALDLQRRSLIDGQAHRISAWVLPSMSKNTEGLDSGLEWRSIVIENSGDEAVYGVRVVTLRGTDERVYGSPIPVLPAHQRLQTQIIHHSDELWPRCEVSFMDSRRRHWVRRDKGGLDAVEFPADGCAIIVGVAKSGALPLQRVEPARQKEERPPVSY